MGRQLANGYSRRPAGSAGTSGTTHGLGQRRTRTEAAPLFLDQNWTVSGPARVSSGRRNGRGQSVWVIHSPNGFLHYNLRIPPSSILDTFHIDLTAVGSDLRLLELAHQPTKYARGNSQTVYTWDYKRLLFGRPIALDVLGIAPIDRLGELTWLGPASVVIFGLLLGLVAHAFNVQNFDRWMLLLVLATFTGVYPLMYFAQECIPLNAAILASSVIVLLVVAIRSVTIMGFRLALLGTVLPAAAILAVTLLAAIHTRLQGILITGTGLAVFVVVMALMPRLRRERATRTTPSEALPASPESGEGQH